MGRFGMVLETKVWRRNGFEWENVLQEELLTTLSSVILNRCGKDTLAWESEEFSVKKTYECASKSNLGNSSGLQIFKILWMFKALPNVLTTA